MNIFHIGICEKDRLYRDELRIMLKRFSNEINCKLKISEFETEESLLKEYEKCSHVYRLLIINTEMNGIDIAKKILNYDPGVAILFISNTQRDAYAAWELDALGYVQKPISYTRLCSLISKAFMYVELIRGYLKEKTSFLHVVVNYKPMDINVDEILFIEKSRNKSLIHTINDDETYACYETLFELHEKLDQKQFLYCHQGYIVNFKKVVAIEKSNIVFCNDIRVPLSKKYYKEFKYLIQDGNNREIIKTMLQKRYIKSSEYEFNRNDEIVN